MSIARWTLLLRLIAGVMGMLAAFLWVRAPRVTYDPGVAEAMALIPPTPSGLRDGARPLDADSAIVAIVEHNLFAPSRRPPATRYRPMESYAESAPADVATPDVSMDPLTASPAALSPTTPLSSGSADPDAPVRAAVPALFGTIMVDGAPSALLRLDARLNAPQLFREGDRAGGYRVVRIREHSVELTGPSGPVTLRLTISGKDMP